MDDHFHKNWNPTYGRRDHNYAAGLASFVQLDEADDGEITVE